MATSRLSTSGDIGGISMNTQLTRTADGKIGHDPELPAAKTGELTTRTNDTDGELTMEAAHGILEADLIDIYWIVAGVEGRRYDVVAGVIDVLDVPISGGSGDVLPAQGTDVTAQVQQVIDTDFDADLVELIGCYCTQRGHISFLVAASNELAVDLPAGELWKWASDQVITNPLAGHVITSVVVTQASTSVATFRLGILYDSTE